VKRKMPWSWVGRLSILKISINLDRSENPCKFCLFACLLGRNLEGDSQLYMEIQRTKKGHGILEEKQSWKSRTTRYQNSLQRQLLRRCGAGGRTTNGGEWRI